MIRSGTGVLVLAAALLQTGCENPTRPRESDTPPLPTSYSVVYLGTLGGAESRAYGINNQGHVVGRARNKDGAWRAFLWREGQMTMLDTLAAPTQTHEAYAINDRGEIVGSSNFDAVVWRAGRIEKLGIGGGARRAAAHGINEAGAIVGGWEDAYPGAHPTGSFVLSNGQVTEIERTTTRSTARGLAINASGEVVGQSALYLATRSFLFKNGQVQPIEGEAANDINDQGQIVGHGYSLGQNAYTQGFLREGSKVTAVHLSSCPVNVCVNRAESINRHGHVVGHTFHTGLKTPDAFVWRKGEGVSLSELSGGRIFWAHAINDQGQIAGLGVNPATGNQEAVLLNPRR